MNDFRITRLPEKWELKAFEQYCKKISKNYKPIENGTTKYIGLEHIKSGFPKLIGIGIESDIRSSKTQFCINDVLFGKLRPYLRKAILAEFDGICSTDILVFRSNDKILPRFLIYLVHSDPFVKYAISTTTGVNHPRTSWNAIKNIKIPVPPIKEQKIIAGVLSLVQNAIAQQEKAIALTTELKKALMQKLFTEGTRKELQKQTEIGLIPESWDVRQLGTMFEIKHGYAFKGKYFDSDGQFILMTPGHFEEDGGFRDQKDKTKYYTGEIPEGYILDKGNLLIAMTEQKSGLLGSSIFVPESNKYLHNQRLGLIQELKESQLNKHFLFHLFNTRYIRYEISKTATGSKVKHTSPIKIRSILVGIPSISEQKIIFDYLDKIDKQIELFLKKKYNLQDLFQTLLHQLMTAKIRVSELNLDSLNLDLEE